MKRKMKMLTALLLALSMCLSQPAQIVLATDSVSVDVTADDSEIASEGESEESAEAEEIEEERDVLDSIEESTTLEEVDAENGSETDAGIALASESIIASGTCGAALTWKLTDDGVLTISGTGAMKDYYTTGSYEAPWYKYCNDINSVIVEEGVTSIGGGAFNNCECLTDVSLPSGILQIGNAAFMNCDMLANIIMPDSVVSIGYYAFWDCDSLKHIDLSNVTSIGESAFNYCIQLTDLVIPDSMVYIGAYAFQQCYALTQIVIPSGVLSIGENAFLQCTGLTEIVVEDGNNNYCDVDGVLFNSSKTELIQYPASKGDINYTIPDGVTKISNSAFVGSCNLVTVIIPESVTEIGENAFSDCESLVEISIPYGINEIPFRCFWFCESLTSIDIPDTVTTIGDEAFYSCWSMTEFCIPESVSSIGDYAFYYCTALKDINIPKNISEIGDYAFYYCINLKEIKFEGDAPSIASNAFRSDTLTAYYPENNNTWTASVLQNYGGTITWVAYDTDTDDETSGKCGDELTWNLVDGILTISGTGKMYDYEEGEAPWYSERADIMFVNIEDGVTSIGSYTFADFPQLLSITIPTTVEIVDDSAFPDSTNLSVVYYAGTSEEWNYIAICSDNSSLLNAQIVCEGDEEDEVDFINFNSSIYHARTLVSGRYEIDSYLDEETVCNIFIKALQDAGTEDYIVIWEAFKTVVETYDDITTLSDLYVDQVDVYAAFILDALEATVSTDDWVYSFYCDTVKKNEKILSYVTTVMKNKYNYDIVGKDLSSLTDDEREKLSKTAGEWFEINYPELNALSDVLGKVSSVFGTVGTIEEYLEYCLNCCALLETDEAIKEVLQYAYEKSAQTYGTLDPLTQAFKKCIDMFSDNVDELLDKLEGGAYIAIGYNAYKYIVGDLLWKNLTGTLTPELQILNYAYKLGKTITNAVFGTDDSAEQYIKMLSIVSIEEVMSETYDELEIAFGGNQIESAADQYLSAMRLVFKFRDLDYEAAYKYVDIMDSSLYGSIREGLGLSDYDTFENSVQSLRGTYSVLNLGAEYSWINYLEEDYPDSGLYEYYEATLYQALDVYIKELTVACPVNVYVYDASGNVVAYVEDGRASCDADDIMVAVIDDEKIIDFYGNTDYTVGLVGYDSGTMDITLNEYDEDGNEIRTVNYYDVELTNGKTYSLNIDDENLQPYVLKNESDNSTVSIDYDSMNGSQSYTLKVISGVIMSDDDISTEITAEAGEAVEVTAYIPEGYEFVCWTSSDDNVRFDNIYDTITTVIMPASDVTVTATVVSTSTSGDEETEHTYGEPTFNWSNDYTSCVAVFSCATCGESVTVDCFISGISTPVNCNTAGHTVYTATYIFQGQEYSDTVTIDIPATGHNAVKVEAKEATDTENGNVEYWYCADCDTYFADEELTEEITLEDTVIVAATGGSDDSNVKDDDKGETENPGEDSGETGEDSGTSGEGSGTTGEDSDDSGSASGSGSTDTESSDGSSDTGASTESSGGSDTDSTSSEASSVTDSTAVEGTATDGSAGTISAEETTSESGNVTAAESVQTGDEGMPFALLAVLFLSGAAISTLAVKRRRYGAY